MPGVSETEWTLRHGDQVAVVNAVGAALRELTVRDRPLVVGWDPARLRPVYRGVLVAPWPNRIADGRYTFGGQEYQVPITEVARHNALHGFTPWARWTVVDVSANTLVLDHRIPAQDGYPFPLDLRATFVLAETGLSTTVVATNLGDRPAPYGVCPHPYLVAGPNPLDTWELSLPATTRLEVDPERLLPVGTAPVADAGCDFRSAAIIGDRFIDHAFTDLLPDEHGRVTVTVTDPAAGTGTYLRFGSSWAPWIQIHTADRPEPDWHRAGLAVEPMSCPPDAFNGPDAAVALAAGATHTAEWTIGAL